MTEYDFSPEAYERHLQNMNRIGNWVQRTNAHSSQFKSPFQDYSPSPSRRRSPSPSTSSDDDDDKYHRQSRHRRKHKSSSKSSTPHRSHHHRSRSQPAAHHHPHHPSRHQYVAPPPAPSRRTTSSSQTASSSAPRTPQPPGVPHRGMTYHGHAAAPTPMPHVAPVRSNTTPGPYYSHHHPQYQHPQVSVIPPNGKPIVVYGGNQQQQQQLQAQYYPNAYYQSPQTYPPQQYAYPSPVTSPQPTRPNTPWFKRIFSIHMGDKSSRSSTSSSRKPSSSTATRHRDERGRSRRTSY